MSVEICPVCGGKGLVPNGFYIAIGTPYYSTTSTAPETCRSCGGKGYIETYDGDVVTQDQQLKELQDRLKKLEDLSNLASLSYGGLSLQVPERCCANCKHIEEGMMYMSNPPKFKCLLHQTWYEWSKMNSKSCDNWEKKE